MPSYLIQLWRKAPFIRLLLFLSSGIVLQWYLQFSYWYWCATATIAICLLIVFYLLTYFQRFRNPFLSGVAVSLLFASLGGIFAREKDIRHNSDWLGRIYTPGDWIIASLDEPLSAKPKSLKAVARVQFIIQHGSSIPAAGRIILYFRKDTAAALLDYGSQVIFKTPLTEINNSGNPGGFDYKRYSLFQGITHQVFLQAGNYRLLPSKKGNFLKRFILQLRSWVLATLKTNIKDTKELGLAEALLIGYKDDLDKSLVRSYTNTGVVHVIAISGLHLGIIYLLLALLCQPLKTRKHLLKYRAIVIIAGLWLFTLLAGAQPSVLRSAVMFTCIVLGESIERRSSIYNNLAFSAFLLLCYNPYWLWDAGFQLSYAAVLSIVIYMKPVYNLVYFENKAMDFLWKMNAVTFAAQLLTIPISIYHFHQFPVYFFLTNFLAVPLSSIILIAEILLCVIFFMPSLAYGCGKIISWMIELMNTYVERVEAIPFALWQGLQINVAQVILLFMLILSFSYWLIEYSKTALICTALAILGFGIFRAHSFRVAAQQQKIIIYNIPQKLAIDFMQGRQCYFIGDASLKKDDPAIGHHLLPSRTLHRTTIADTLPGLWRRNNHISFLGKKILLADGQVELMPPNPGKQKIDLLVISNNPRLYMKRVMEAYVVDKVVFAGANSDWKTSYWKRDCDSMGISYHDVEAKGAFVMTLR